MNLYNETVSGFWDWFKRIKWLGIPAWIFVVFGGLGNSVKTNNTIDGIIIDYVGYLLFALFCLLAYYKIKKPKEPEQITQSPTPPRSGLPV